MLEAQMVAALSPLVGGRFYPDLAPPETTLPYVVWQQVGSMVVDTLEGEGSCEKIRIQLLVWASSRLEAITIQRQLRDILLAGDLVAEMAGGSLARNEEVLQLYGQQQDFYLGLA